MQSIGYGLTVLRHVSPCTRFGVDSAVWISCKIPNRFNRNSKCTFSFRPLIVSDAATLEAELNGRVIWKRKFTWIKPAEMLKIELSAEQLNESGTLVFRLREEA